MIHRIPLGQGIRRDLGAVSARQFPGAMWDLRNAEVGEGWIQPRAGLSVASPNSGIGISGIVGIVGLRAELTGIFIGYNDSSRQMNVYRVNGDGSGAEYLGAWHPNALHSAARLPPRVYLTDADGTIFFAHSDLISRRVQTKFYDPSSTTPIAGLDADLTGAGGFQPVRFRGVAHWLHYLIGWGFGTVDEDRPELVRISVPGQPTVFRPNHYFIAGAIGDPVIDVKSAGGYPIVFKRSEAYYIRGTGWRDFGIKESDTRYGQAAENLAVRVGQSLFVWTLEGPRRWTGPGESEDLAMPLELDGAPDPVALDEDLLEVGFGYYVPEKQEVVFWFDDGGFVLDLRRKPARWHYRTSGLRFWSAGTLYTGGTLQPIPEDDPDPPDDPPPEPPPPGPEDPAIAGYPEWNDGFGSGSDGANEFDTHLETQFRQRRTDGGEGLSDPSNVFIQVWAWADGTPSTQAFLAYQATVDQAGGPDDATLQRPDDPGDPGTDPEPLTPGTLYHFAARYRKGTAYNSGAGGSDPAAWPGASQGQATTTATGPTLDSLAWQRTGAADEQVDVEFMPSLPAEDIEIWRSDDDSFSEPGSASFSLVETVAAATHGGAQHTHADDTVAGEKWLWYKVRHLVAGGSPTAFTAAQRVWSGPINPETADGRPQYDSVEDESAGSLYAYRAHWTYPAVADSSWFTRVYDDYTCCGSKDPGLNTFEETVGGAPGGGAAQLAVNLPDEFAGGLTLKTLVQHRVEHASGTDDFTPKSVIRNVFLEEDGGGGT